MKKLLLLLFTVLGLWGTAHASSEGPAWDRFPVERASDPAALRRGAKLFVNHCMNCHEAAFMRFNRLRDIGLSEEQIRTELIFTGAKVGDLMKSAMATADAKAWFGAAPPDLTLIARSRADAARGSGADYLYTYLRSFYVDETRPMGWNNLAFPNAAMPNVLWELQGPQRAVFVDEKDPHDPARSVHAFKGLEPMAPGTLTAAEFNDSVADLVAFLAWMSEPVRAERGRLGVWVLLFLGVFTLIAWRLNAAYWKDIR